MPRPKRSSSAAGRADAGVSLADLRLLAKLEGRPLPRGDHLAEVLGMNPSAAWKFVRRMRRAGVLRLVSPMRRPVVYECITELEVGAAKAADLDALERRMAADPSVVQAARVSGRYDYRLFSRHADIWSASDWSRSWEAEPGVARVRARLCRTLWDRTRLAEGILGPDAA